MMMMGRGWGAEWFIRRPEGPEKLKYPKDGKIQPVFRHCPPDEGPVMIC